MRRPTNQEKGVLNRRIVTYNRSLECGSCCSESFVLLGEKAESKRQVPKTDLRKRHGHRYILTAVPLPRYYQMTGLCVGGKRDLPIIVRKKSVNYIEAVLGKGVETNAKRENGGVLTKEDTVPGSRGLQMKERLESTANRRLKY